MTQEVAGQAIVLSVSHLKKYFQTGGVSWLGKQRPPVRAVDDISFTVRRGETFGLVGESGSGKTTVAKMLLRLENPTAGEITFGGDDIFAMAGAALKEFRASTQVVFQDPNSSLSPRMRVRDIIGEPLAIQGVARSEREQRVEEVLTLVGLNAGVAARYPHEFSGGQRQRIAIARAIVASPTLIVLDEPVSALDVSIRAQILNLLRDLQERLDLTYVMIAHDLAVVYQACDRIGVMYLGRLAELAPSEELYRAPRHPYTKILLSSIPIADPAQRDRERIPLVGEIPSPSAPPPGCRFHPRCPIAADQCRVDEPEWREVSPEHWVACHFA